VVGFKYGQAQTPHLYDFVYAGEDQQIWVLDFNQTREDCDAYLKSYGYAKGYHCISAVYLEDAR
jgi:hypothetical protein